jgi:periplasmic protein TonB
MGTRAIFKPMPEIPDELRQHPMTRVALARFRIASDGSATVELIEPTSNPLLNRVLLATLQRWRFFPAMAQGRPVASIVDIRIPIEVK